jgi:hypothetical protein
MILYALLADGPTILVDHTASAADARAPPTTPVQSKLRAVQVDSPTSYRTPPRHTSCVHFFIGGESRLFFFFFFFRVFQRANQLNYGCTAPGKVVLETPGGAPRTPVSAVRSSSAAGSPHPASPFGSDLSKLVTVTRLLHDKLAPYATPARKIYPFESLEFFVIVDEEYVTQ